MGRRTPTYRPELDPGYLAELRARVDAIGFRAVARAGGMGLATLWRVLAADADQPPTLDAMERVRAAIMKADPKGPAVPAPFVATRGAAHAAWCALGAELARTHPTGFAAVVTAPDAIRATVRAAGGRSPRKPRRR
jgi:hypothetical protein